jgi:hypothetical protein
VPYRLNPNNKKQVQVKKSGRWQVLKSHSSLEAAKKHLAALKINVKK